MMNSVLENFTILQVRSNAKLNYYSITNFVSFIFSEQVVSNRETNETLLCIAYVFEVANSNCGAQHHIYRLVKDQSQH